MYLLYRWAKMSRTASFREYKVDNTSWRRLWLHWIAILSWWLPCCWYWGSIQCIWIEQWISLANCSPIRWWRFSEVSQWCLVPRDFHVWSPWWEFWYSICVFVSVMRLNLLIKSNDRFNNVSVVMDMDKLVFLLDTADVTFALQSISVQVVDECTAAALQSNSPI